MEDHSCCPPAVDAGQTLRGIFSSDPRWAPERSLLKSTVISALALVVLTLLLQSTLFASVPNFTLRYLPLLLLGAVVSAFIAGCGYHFLAYKNPVSCSVGMMEGMTFGMMSGFMIGALLGGSNGMFWGSVVSMLLSSLIGVWAGKCCGVMGVLEGLMAGIMGGTMGAMLSVMLIADPLPLFLALLVAMCSLVLVGLAYMRIVEHGKLKDDAPVEPASSVLATSSILYVFLVLFMVYGPVSGVVWGL